MWQALLFISHARQQYKFFGVKSDIFRLYESSKKDFCLIFPAKVLYTRFPCLCPVWCNFLFIEMRVYAPFQISFKYLASVQIVLYMLTGNSITVMLACLNQHPSNYEETLNTLQFAARCSSIQIAPHVNVVVRISVPFSRYRAVSSGFYKNISGQDIFMFHRSSCRVEHRYQGILIRNIYTLSCKDSSYYHNMPSSAVY